NLSLTAPVSTPEVSSLHEHSYCCPFHIVHKPLQSPFQGRQSSFLSLRRERLRQAKQRATGRISQYRMGSTSTMSSFPGAAHEVNGGGI
ncbi:hypothetical protein TNIN_202841, partial [Trichonephila inaurata madagascariensis]